MLNEKRIKLMTRMAIYEEHEGKEDFKISSYYQKDYASLHMWFSLIWATIGYGIIVVGILFINMEKIFTMTSISAFVALAGAIVGAYIFLLVIVGIISREFYKRKHIAARKRVKQFHHNLMRLEKMYEKETK